MRFPALELTTNPDGEEQSERTLWGPSYLFQRIALIDSSGVSH